MVTMFESTCSVLRKLAVSLTLAALVLPSVANAQAAPAGGLPSYAHPAPQHEQITGTVTNFDGKYVLLLNDDRGFVDTVQLRDGTIINPTGLRLIEGMRVTVTGFTSGKTFVALQIDTPYTMTSAVPADAPAYYAYGTAYPYYSGYPGYYGAYPWYYPVAAFGLGIAFGAAWNYWGPYGYYGYRGGYYGGGYYGYRGGYYGYRGGYYGGGYGYRGGYGGRNPAVPYNGGYNTGYHGSTGGYGGYNGGYHGSSGGYNGGYHGSSGGGGMHASGGGHR